MGGPPTSHTWRQATSIGPVANRAARGDIIEPGDRPPKEGCGIRPFETFDHTADIGLVVRGATAKELFEHAAEGLVDLMVDPVGLREETRVEVTVSAPDREALLVAWLNELLYLLDTREFLPRRCRITQMSETGLTAELLGEAIDPDRHTLRRMVKAATYHGLRIQRTNTQWEGRVILDL